MFAKRKMRLRKTSLGAPGSSMNLGALLATTSVRRRTSSKGLPTAGTLRGTLHGTLGHLPAECSPILELNGAVVRRCDEIGRVKKQRCCGLTASWDWRIAGAAMSAL